MKKLTIVFLLFTSYLISQNSNFIVESDGNIVFKKVYVLEDNNKINLVNYLKTLSNIQITESDNEITGTIEDLRINFKKFGKKGGYPIFLRYSLSSNFRIQLKENKYRLIISNIGFLDDVSLYSSITYKESDNFTYLTEYYVKNDGSIRNNKMTIRTLDAIDKHLTTLFTIKQIDDDW
tara:strand:+ start:327 stop:860 length:534 start_codon:yes stop_codon:yes gene_type:complete